MTIPADRLALYEALISLYPQVERKGVTMPYTSFAGNMFSFLSSAGVMGLRLPEAAREAFLAKHRTRLCEQHGRVLVEYVEVPAALLKKTKELGTYFAQSLAYAQTLKPKATKRAPIKKKK